MKGFSESIATVILLLVSFGFAASLFLMFNGLGAPKAITVEEIAAYCSNNTATFVIRNGGKVNLTKASFVCSKTSSNCLGNCIVDQNFSAGGAGYVRIYNCSTGTQKFSLAGVANSLQLVVYCK